jgi:hypothetical protein
MVSMWMPGAKILKARSDGGAMDGGPAKVVWHTTENDPNRFSALSLANYLRSSGNDVHIVWNPVRGENIQAIPANRAGKGLKNTAGGVQTNRAGKYVIQIEVVGQATKPFTNTACKNLDKILAWLRDLGIPATWPAGAPKSYPASYGGIRSRSSWTHSGHFGHSQVPENVHGDPGGVDWKKLTDYPETKPAFVRQPVPLTPAGDRWLGLYNPQLVGNDVNGVRNVLRMVGNRIDATGPYDRQIADLIQLFQENRNIDERGVGPETWQALRVIAHR